MEICKQCGGIAEWNSYVGGITCTRCSHVEKPKPTNADRIRSMTDEELAQFFLDAVACENCPVGHEKCHREFTSCKDAALDWLKSPVQPGEVGK